jgi:hypothetical protein
MIRANQVAARRGWEWLKTGWTLFHRAPSLWLGLATVYLVITVVLQQIPFIGILILMLFTPLLLLGALSLAQALTDDTLPADAVPARPAGREWRPWALYLRDLLGRSARRLFRGFSDEEKLLPIMVVSTLLLGGLVAIRILAQLLKVSSTALPAVLASGVGPSVLFTTLLGLLIVLTLETLLLMAFLYVVPLILFRGEHPLPAIESSFSATLGNLGAFTVFASAFILAGQLAGMLFFYLFFPLDYLVFLAIGLVALPVLTGGLYASYRDLYPPASRAIP